MEQVLQVIINGIVLGGFYAVMVLGFSVIWGVMGVINLAHGEFIMVGAYITWLLNTEFGMEPFVTLLIVFPAMFVLGYVLQRTVINPLVEKPHLMSLIVTFGLAVIMANVVKLLFTGTPRSVATEFSGFWRLGELTIPVTKTIILGAALLTMLALHFFLKNTRLGKSIRAAAQNKEAARIVGIKIDRVYALTFGICIAITGAAGMYLSPTVAIFPFMGPPLTLRAFAITAFAGLGSIHGALFGGLLLGLVEAFVGTYVRGVGTNMAIIAAFVLLVVVLITRPQGLFGGLRPATEAA